MAITYTQEIQTVKEKFLIAARAINNAANERINMFLQRMVNKLAGMVIRNPDTVMSALAAVSSAQYEKTHLVGCPDFKYRRDFFKTALSHVKVQGMNLEFGTYKGDSINLLASLKPSWSFFGFDSFEGLPGAWGVGSPAGTFSLDGDLPPVRDNVKLIKGFYDSTLHEFLKTHPEEKVAFLHMDSDIYESTSFVLDALEGRIVSGTVIVFDDFLNYWGWQEHDFKAFEEFVSKNNLRFKYIAQMRYTGRVAVEIV